MKKNINRVIWIVLDSVGMGELPDAEKFNDEGSDTIGNTSKAVGGLDIPNLVKLGLGNIDFIHNVDSCDTPVGCFGRMAEISNGKDTTIGHWEMAGIYSPEPFPVYPDGFPDYIINEFIKENNLPGILFNRPASGTEIINKLGNMHVKSGKPIIYTSADSVFQIAAHESIIPPDKLYVLCQSARDILKGKDAVARVIARPFIGEKGKYTRTANRRDFSLKPTTDNILCRVADSGREVIGVGKIEDIFAGVGITKAAHTKDNQNGIDVTIDYMKQSNKGIIYTNLVEFDSVWGHRNDYEGYARGLHEFDMRLPQIISAMNEDDILVITADHGCDPTTPSTDHSREYVPLLVYGKCIRSNVNLSTRKTYADIAQTIADLWDLKPTSCGTSFLNQII
ncbi:MAG: phosphopentomutase [Eubacteriales bacterium]|nr:phosphopentomutase [Eubacteriales bacterium]